MAEYLLDSDVLIWCLRGRESTVSFVQNLASDSLPSCSSLSILEVELGMRKEEERETIRFLDSLRVLPVTKENARQAATYMRGYGKRGIDFVDSVIAATCLQEGLILVTFNLKHYPMGEIDKISPPQ